MVPQVQLLWIYQTKIIDGYLSPGLFVNTVSETVAENELTYYYVIYQIKILG